MNNIDIDYRVVEHKIKSLQNKLVDSRQKLMAAYADASSVIADYKGETAEAFEELLTEEKALMKELYNTLEKFTGSIQFAANEFSKLDQGIAVNMNLLSKR